MSKWINKDLFTKFQEQKKNEQEKAPTGAGRMEIIWKNPDKGTIDKPRIYEGRFLTDPNGRFYEKYLYHMFYSNEKWHFVLCEKTFSMENFCPLCTVTSKLYMSGNKVDKEAAKKYGRKERFCGNWYVVDDPRDVEMDDPEKKANGKVKIYEFPGKLESKVKNEITDVKNGLGLSIFDPGDDGYNFIIKVKSTKPTGEGKTFPDYADSIFSRKPTALGNDNEIRDIMSKTINVTEYINSMRMNDDNIMALLKAEMVWELVSSEWNENKKKKGMTVASSTTTVEQENNTPSSTNEKEDIKKDIKKDEDSVPFDQSDEELLKELENM